MRIVLGVDPGFGSTGYGVIGLEGSRLRHIAHGVITTSPQLQAGKRLLLIAESMRSVAREFSPHEASVESIFLSRNARSAMSVAQARGVVLLVLAEHGIVSYDYSPLVIKKAVVGNAKADKQQVQEILRMLFGFEQKPTPTHAADALAAAVCHANTASYRERTDDQ